MNTEDLQKIIEVAAQEYADDNGLFPNRSFTMTSQNFKAGCAFALPLGEERGFRLAIETLKNKGRHVIQDKDVFNWLEQEGKKLGILK